MFFEIGVLKNFAIFTGKHLWWSLFLIKLKAFKKRLQHMCFPLNIAKFLRIVFYMRWLLLYSEKNDGETVMYVIHFLTLKSPTSEKWSNTLQQIVGDLPTICLSVFDHFMNLALKGLSTKITKWSNTLKQFVGNLPTNCFSVFDHFVGLALKGLINETFLIILEITTVNDF